MLDDDWFVAQAAAADAGLEKRGLVASMEVRCEPAQNPNANQHALLDATAASKISTWGWPIGVTLNREGCSPKPTTDGIRTEISFPADQSNAGHSSYDYWAFRSNGHFYTQIKLFEDDRGGDVIYFNTRIIRVAETFMFLQGVYRLLSVPEDTQLTLRVRHKGLAGRTLTAVGNRFITPAKTDVEEATAEISFALAEIETRLPELVKNVCDGLFVIFDFTKIGLPVFQDIITRFRAGETS